MCKQWSMTAVALMLGFAWPVNAQEAIGKASSVKPEARGSVAGPLATDTDVHARETVSTGSSGQADLVFLDKTNLSIGPMSTVRLDKFVYDPNRRGGTVVINATRGAYRFVTGVQEPRSYEIRTPYATLGVRGTILEVVIGEPVRAGRRAPARKTAARQ